MVNKRVVKETVPPRYSSPSLLELKTEQNGPTVLSFVLVLVSLLNCLVLFFKNTLLIIR